MENTAVATKAKKPTSQFKKKLRKFCNNRLAMIGFIVLVIMIGACIAAPLLTQYDQATPDFSALSQAPSQTHIFGTDSIGRDIFARTLYGGRISIMIAVVSAVIGAVIGCILGGLSLSQIWGLFGAANQLLAGIALMAVCAWLGQAGKNNKMFYVPMVFMLAATLSSLLITVRKKLVMICDGEALWGDWFQLFFAAAMAILAIFLVVEGIQTFKKQKSLKKA